jgi:Mn2+/Fe2+ NRAMP family transporter
VAELRPPDVAAPGHRVARASFAPLADRRSLLDRAHRGDIQGALGRVAVFDTGPRPSLGRRLTTLLAIMGPGIVVMVADNDAGGLAVYAQAGQNHGLRLLPVLVLLAPVLFVNQEMVARLGAVSGAGHARLIFERFGRRWGSFALADLLLLNFLTLVTEFIGVALALGYFGVSRFVSVPLAATTLVGVTTAGSFRRWERAMYALVAVSLLALPLVVLTYLHHAADAAVVMPAGGAGGNLPLLVIALVGTTVAPWQLFFHQSNVVDKRITARWLSYERVDTLLGAVLFTLGAMAVLLACALAFAGGSAHGEFVDAGRTADALRHAAGSWAGALFASTLLFGSVLGAGAVTLATSYAIGDVFGLKHSLHRGRRDARVFHGSFVALVALAAAAVLIPGVPLGVATVGVQALAGVLLPSATVFLLLLCNDEAVLGPRTNPRWLNALGTVVVGSLIMLSALLTITTVFPDLDTAAVAVALAAVLGSVLAGLAVADALSSRPRPRLSGSGWDRQTWTTPPLETLPPPPPSSARMLGLVVLRVYLFGAVALAAVRVVGLMIRG